MRRLKPSSARAAVGRRERRQRAQLVAGLLLIVGGFGIFILHVFEIALTDHPWFTIAQWMLFGGAFLVLGRLWGTPRRARR